ncbi:MAG TPA: hypothetical protein VL400_25130 [Polyangiaceae bacterium]|nr:hypothetical protein [Polyangiaceae bacterium]
MTEGRSSRWPRRQLLRGAVGLGVAAASRASRADEAEAPPAGLVQIAEGAPLAFLPAGRTVVRVTVPRATFTTIGLLGPQRTLLGLSMFGGELARLARSRGPIDEDGLLPRFIAFGPRPAEESFDLCVDVVDPVEIRMAVASEADEVAPTQRGLARGTEKPRPLVSMPIPSGDADGYALGIAARYLFLRVDVARLLLAAFAKTKKKMGGDPIQLSDASQWNGKRPRSDIDVVRHISHEGGCDVDLGLPANDTFPSSVRDHCRGVRLDGEHFGCSPGTAKGVDFSRLAYFLGLLADEGVLVKVFIDDAYRREVVRAAHELADKGMLGAAATTMLGEDGVLVASPWHTDHFHVRFWGEKGRAPFEDVDAPAARG